jgi:hypothetical protein
MKLLLKFSSIFAFCFVISTGDVFGANLRNCSLNGGPKSRAELISSPKILTIYWENGQVVRLIRISSREFVDSSGARWFKMSNTNFLGLWSEDGGKRKEVYCSKS